MKWAIQHLINGQVTFFFFGCFLPFKMNPQAKLIFDTFQMHSDEPKFALRDDRLPTFTLWILLCIRKRVNCSEQEENL